MADACPTGTSKCPVRTFKCAGNGMRMPRKDFEVPRGDFETPRGDFEVPREDFEVPRRDFFAVSRQSRRDGRRRARGDVIANRTINAATKANGAAVQDHDRTGRDTFHADENEVPRRAFYTLPRQSRRDRRRRMHGDVVAIRTIKRRDNRGRGCNPRSRPDRVSHLLCR